MKKSDTKVAIYARVSTKKQDDSLKEQIRILHEFADFNGYEVVRVYAEIESGGNTKAREKFNEMMNDIKTTKMFDIVLISKLDRLSRSLIDLVNTTKVLEEYKIELVSHGDNFDTTTPNGRLLFHLLSAIAEFERAIIRERMETGMARAKREGKICHRPRKKIDMEKVKDLINKENSYADIARVFGVSYPTLWRRMDEAGIKAERRIKE